MTSKGEATHSARRLWVLGLSQALGFIVGALLGRYLGLLLGCDALAGDSGYSMQSMVGILLIGFGGGAGVQLARRWYIRRYGDPRA
jgi:F0F1-type ATP synthase assembly protein I